MASARFRLGVNYWPARTAMAWWEQFDPGELDEDFARIADAGLDSVRLFLTWESFQPGPQTTSQTMLDRLVVVADSAARHGLDLMPTLFTGHMSGVNWIPAWALGAPTDGTRFRVVDGKAVARRQIRDWFSDPEIGESQVRLAAASARALAGHPALWAWDLGNENSNCVVPADRTAALGWLGRITDAIRAADATAAVTIGLHAEDLEEDRKLGPAEAATVCDFLTMHGYPIYLEWAEGPTDEHVLGFLTEVTRWLSGGLDVLFSEFGLPTVHPAPAHPAPAHPAPAHPMLVDEQEAAHYTGRALDCLQAAGATGAMLWCANDYAPEIWAEPPLDEAIHERSFGLWRADATPKPAVASVSSRRHHTVTSPPDQSWLDLDPADFYTETSSHLARLYPRYRSSRGLANRSSLTGRGDG